MRTAQARRVVGVTAAAVALAGSALASAAAHAPAASAVTIYKKLEVRHSGQVMEILGPSHAENQPANQWPWHGGTWQQWEQIYVSSTPSGPNTGYFILKNRLSGKCLDIQGGSSLAPSTPLVQATCDPTASQRWFMHKAADVGLLTPKGYRYIFNKHSGLVIDVANASHQAGAKLVQYPAKPLHQADNQLWHFDIGAVG